ncbi:hypothetical protein VCSRO39_3261 [Vibrio cholerae]|nr:putative O-antigen polymerase [Vibrio cholerae]GIA54220.1 hypothetical protein VCSRO39_3261 [Vibrio cholerae]
MFYLINIIIILIAKLGLFFAFFYFSKSLSSTDFKIYALNFSIWQLVGQIATFQMGTTLFRIANRRVLKKTFIKINYYVLFFLSLSLMACYFFVGVNNFAFSIVCGFVYASFILMADYSRSIVNEKYVYFMYAAPLLAYLIFEFLSHSINVTVYTLMFLEMLSYALATLFLCSLLFRNKAVEVRSYKISPRELKCLMYYWSRLSKPLLINNAVWYFYFNAPQIIAYTYTISDNDFKELAVLFRFIVAISTLSSIFALVFQKKIILEHDKNYNSYCMIKDCFKKTYFPVILFFPVIFGYSIELMLSFNSAYYQYVMGFLGLRFSVLSMFASIFLGLYFCSHYFVAEKDMKVISPSMIIGFFVYLGVFVLLDKGSSEFPKTLVTSLFCSLTCTLMIRYIYLLRMKNNA